MSISIKPWHEGGSFQPIPWPLCGKLSNLETCGTILVFESHVNKFKQKVPAQLLDKTYQLGSIFPQLLNQSTIALSVYIIWHDDVSFKLKPPHLPLWLLFLEVGKYSWTSQLHDSCAGMCVHMHVSPCLAVGKQKDQTWECLSHFCFCCC